MCKRMFACNSILLLTKLLVHVSRERTFAIVIEKSYKVKPRIIVPCLCRLSYFRFFFFLLYFFFYLYFSYGVAVFRFSITQDKMSHSLKRTLIQINCKRLLFHRPAAVCCNGKENNPDLRIVKAKQLVVFAGYIWLTG